MSGLSEYVITVFMTHGINICHKPHNTLRTKTCPERRREWEVISSVTAVGNYLGEMSHTLGNRLGESQKLATSAVTEHQSTAAHETDWAGVRIIDQEMLGTSERRLRRPSTSDNIRDLSSTEEDGL